MSKLYKKYILLKIQNPEKIYIFESGIFYLFIHNDAELMSKLLNLKLTALNSLIPKCGFPVKSSEKYFNLLRSLNYNFEIVPASNESPIELTNFIDSKKYESIIGNFVKIDIDSLSISEAFDTLHKFQKELKDVK